MERRDNVEELLVAHILKNIRNKTAPELLDIHQKMDVSLKEMIMGGLRPGQLDDLALDCSDFLKEQLDKQSISSEELLDAGINEKLLNHLSGSFVDEDPPEDHLEPTPSLEFEGLSLSQKKEELKAEYKMGKASAPEIKNYLDMGYIAPSELELSLIHI